MYRQKEYNHEEIPCETIRINYEDRSFDMRVSRAVTIKNTGIA